MVLRPVIFHYHFFKNAGTSVDALLQHNFPDRWVTKEFDNHHYPSNVGQCREWLRQEPLAVAFSSHTALLPPPVVEGIEILPVFFLRHPIDRIESAYVFESNQKRAQTPGAILARQTDLKGYVEAQLGNGRFSQCRNFHLSKLRYTFLGKAGEPVDIAKRYIDSLPFVGLVERYDMSIARLVAWLSAYFPDMRAVMTTKNVSRSIDTPLEHKLDNIRQQLGAELYDRLIDANSGDLALYEHVKGRF